MFQKFFISQNGSIYLLDNKNFIPYYSLQESFGDSSPQIENKILLSEFVTIFDPNGLELSSPYFFIPNQSIFFIDDYSSLLSNRWVIISQNKREFFCLLQNLD